MGGESKIDGKRMRPIIDESHWILTRFCQLVIAHSDGMCI